jgi:hypothetical protein
MDLSLNAQLSLALCLFAGATLYASVGHAGASAYIAAMALFGVAPETMRPTALVLNIFVALFGVWRYGRAGLTNWRATWPFLLGSVPMAFLGGALQLPGAWYRPLLGAVLLVAAARLLWPGAGAASPTLRDPPVLPGVALGAAIGLLSGLTGTGGGIFLSPLLIFMGWASLRGASGVAIGFILANSVASLAGTWSKAGSLPAEMPLYVGAVMLGASLGAWLGVGRLSLPGVSKALGLVLVIAGLKMFGAW